jgi:enoyl-[acyl-carrier protein] reductase II
MFEGDLENGELEIGQISGLIDEVKPVADIVDEIMAEYRQARKAVGGAKLEF